MNKPNPHCKPFATIAIQQAGLKMKDISCVESAGGYFVETPNQKRECSAHCKWCAIAETVFKEGE